MSYIGNTSTTQTYAAAIDYFSGNGVTTAFTLSRPVASVAQLIVTVANVIQNPTSAFTVSGSTITFTSAPPSGSNNIWVEYTSPITQTIAPSDGTVGTSSLNTITSINSGSSNLSLKTNSTTAVTIDTSQNVGIGLTSPASKLDVYQEARVSYANGNQYRMRFTNTDGNGRILVDGDASNLIFGTSVAGTNATATERARIDSSGNLLVGASSSAVGYRAFISSNSGVQLALNAVSGQRYTEIDFRNNDAYKAGIYYDATNDRLYEQCVSAGVYLANGGTSWTSASDERVKDIIEPIDNAVQKLFSWRTVIGKYKTDQEGTRRSFLIAQDVQATFPEAVDTTNSEEYGLRYQDIIPILVKAIQEQQQIIEDLKARIEVLENK